MCENTIAAALLFISISMLAYAGDATGFKPNQTKPNQTKPKEGFVPDSKTAIRIAVAVWIPIYGEAPRCF